MDASSQPAAAVSTTLADWFATPLGQLSAHARAGVVRPDRRRHLRLPRDPDRAARVRVPGAEPDRDALDRRLRRRPRSCAPTRTGCRSPRTRSTSSCCRTRSSSPTEPHQLLREVYRAVRPEGQVVIAGLQSVQPVRRQALLRPRADARRGTAISSRSTGSRTGWRCSASRSPAAASTATCRRSQPENWLRALRRSSSPPATAGGRSPAASTTCARPRRVTGMRVITPAWQRPQARRWRRRRGRRASASSGRPTGDARHRRRRRSARCTAATTTSYHPHRRRVQGQPRPRRLGRAARMGRPRARALRRRGARRPTTGWSSPR